MKKVAVFISGNGSNLKNLAEKALQLKSEVEISLVVSNVSNVKGLEIAKNYSLKTCVLESDDKKITINHKNIQDYNAFAALKSKAEKAFDVINKHLIPLKYNYSLTQLLEEAVFNIDAISDFPEEDIKEGILTDVFLEAFEWKEENNIVNLKNDVLVTKIDNILYDLMDEIKIIAKLFQLVKRNPNFINFFLRDKYDEELDNILKSERIDYIFLAGFMRILGSSFTKKWNKRIFNIHPSLLPAFGGAKAVKEALDYGVKITGCTVHYVGDGVDDGEIIAQTPIEVKKGDTIESLHARIKGGEEILYPHVLELLANNKI